ncbi:good for full dbp5 activity protein 2 [Scheffersomyces coipomensis]|uniref:good for full dbp5 activity protein 2 n=1 Tax=Scheffersomyces coipomensis TaxID=1788519 RepID=UPI00315D0A64
MTIIEGSASDPRMTGNGSSNRNEQERSARPHSGFKPRPKSFTGIVIPPQDIKQVQTHISNIPRLKHLDTLSDNTNPIFQSIIDDYFVNNNFKHHPSLSNAHQLNYLRSCISQVYGRKSILFCIDVEAYEMNTNIITEIGICIYDPRDQLTAMMPTINQIHIKINEHFDKFNGRFVPNHTVNFNGGTSFVMPITQAATLTQSLINYYFFETRNNDIRTCLIGHDVKGDIKWLNTLGVKFPENVPIIDSHKLFALTQGKNGNSLKNALTRVQVPYAFLHNAGNDAYYTLLLVMRLCDPQCRRSFSLDVMKPLDINKEGIVPLMHDVSLKSKKSKAKKHNVADLIMVESAEEAATLMFATS